MTLEASSQEADLTVASQSSGISEYVMHDTDNEQPEMKSSSQLPQSLSITPGNFSSHEELRTITVPLSNIILKNLESGMKKDVCKKKKQQ
jgi:hypothetical protein